jgi:riboflavin kinase/FMN adenylyltransferase
MKILPSPDRLPAGAGCAVTIGNFDGIHIGHYKIISELVKTAKKRNLKSLLISFTGYDTKDESRLKLMQDDEKTAILSKLGLDYKIIINLHAVKHYSYADFLHVLSNEYHMKVLVASDKLRFGLNREGTPNRILEAVKCMKLSVLVTYFKSVKINNINVSSTRIREYIKDGNVRLAARYLGRPYCVDGVVIKGKALGRKIGFPTINIRPPTDIHIPAYGVYITVCKVDDVYEKGVTFVGRPFNEHKSSLPLVETYLLNFSKSVYNKHIKIYFLKYLRKQVKVKNIKHLTELISDDTVRARRFFSGRKAAGESIFSE